MVEFRPAQGGTNGQDRGIADDVENHTLRLLQEMRSEMRERFDRVELRLDRLDGRQQTVEVTLANVIDAVTQIATVQEKHSGILAELVESERITGGRLNALEARLGRIEKQTGLVLQ
jgi:3-dehydroquinate dehydratase